MQQALVFISSSLGRPHFHALTFASVVSPSPASYPVYWHVLLKHQRVATEHPPCVLPPLRCLASPQDRPQCIDLLCSGSEGSTSQQEQVHSQPQRSGKREATPTHYNSTVVHLGRHDNWCTGTLLSRTITAQWKGMEDAGSARYEPAQHPPCPTIKVLSYNNCQRSTHSISKWIFRNLTLLRVKTSRITYHLGQS